MPEWINSITWGIDIVEDLRAALLAIMNRQMPHATWPTECQLARGIRITKQYFRCGSAGFLSRVVSRDDGRYSFAKTMQRHRLTVVQKKNNRFPGSKD